LNFSSFRGIAFSSAVYQTQYISIFHCRRIYQSSVICNYLLKMYYL